MIEVLPMMSLSAFLVGLLLFLLMGRAIVELYLSKQKKSPQDCANNPAGINRTASRAVQRYYNKNRERGVQ